MKLEQWQKVYNSHFILINANNPASPKKSVFAKMNARDPNAQVIIIGTRSSWLNCALRDDEAVYWVSVGHYEAVAVGN